MHILHSIQYTKVKLTAALQQSRAVATVLPHCACPIMVALELVQTASTTPLAVCACMNDCP
jgi:hypothetical protein